MKEVIIDMNVEIWGAEESPQGTPQVFPMVTKWKIEFWNINL